MEGVTAALFINLYRRYTLFIQSNAQGSKYLIGACKPVLQNERRRNDEGKALSNPKEKEDLCKKSPHVY
jgi:hypothetical protein